MRGPSAETARRVEERAGGRCEYCRMHQALQGATFHVEHIRPRSRGGRSDLDNLAWCRPGRNLRKSVRIEASDPGESAIVPLFHPRRHSWREHFSVGQDGRLDGLTPEGRATVQLMDMNDMERVHLRSLLLQRGWRP